MSAVPAPPSDTASTETVRVDRFLVCGLGSLGQYCVYNLKKFALPGFEVHVTAIDRAFPQDLEVDNLRELLSEEPIYGDCCNDQVLLRAGVQECRAILLVTSSESVNIEAAIAARRLNPRIRLIVRSAKQNLNQLLKLHLGNFAAFEATELPAPSFALAGLRAGILGTFNIGSYRLQVVEQTVQRGDYRFDGFPTAMLHKKNYRLLSYHAVQSHSHLPTRITASSNAFYQWQADTRVSVGDRIAFIELIEEYLPHRRSNGKPKKQSSWKQIRTEMRSLFQPRLRSRWKRFWQWLNFNQTRRAVGLGVAIASLLWVLGVFLLTQFAGMTPSQAASVAVVLLLGGYGDVFGGTEPPPDNIPGWVQFFCLLITLASLLFILGVLGLIADNLLSSRFSFLRKRPPIPREDHVVLVGLGRVGQRIVTLLQEFKQPLVAITEQLDNALLMDQVPVIVGDPIHELERVNLLAAKSVIVVTDDPMLNLEVGLMAREAAYRAKHDIELVIRTYDQRFSDNIANLLPDARILAAYGLSGAAFAGAAFGENILGLFRLNDQTILVTEYLIAAGDTLVSKMLAQVAYGYGVVPIFHERTDNLLKGEAAAELMPSDDRMLGVGDRLIVLSTINGLRRIERGDLAPPKHWKLEAKKPLSTAFLLNAGSDLSRISGCSLEAARIFMENLPGTMELRLYDYQAHQLREKLSRDIPITLYEL